MTLATVPRYTPNERTESGERAIVIGSGMAGLVAARVLSNHFSTVTVLDRDPVPDVPTARRGVPQGRHPHILLEAGRATLEDIIPGFTDAVLEAGGQVIQDGIDLHMYAERGYLAPGRRRLAAYYASRPLYEQIVRDRVLERSGIELRPECQFLTYIHDPATQTITGVRCRTGSDTVDLAADLVIDASGRTSRTPRWLAAHGYPRPERETVRIDVAYSTTVIERPATDRRAYLMHPTPPRTRGGTVIPIEGNRWLVTMHGIHGDHAPTDRAGFIEFAERLPIPEPARLLHEQPWTTDEIDTYPFPANRRYRYDTIDRFPSGLVVIGDAIASFNPVYGQGMSIAILESVLLHHALVADGTTDLWERYIDRASDLTDIAWLMAVGADFRFGHTDGHRPRGTGFFNRYLARLVQGAHTDAVLTDAFHRVIMLEAPPSTLFRPRVMWHVLRPTG